MKNFWKTSAKHTWISTSLTTRVCKVCGRKETSELYYWLNFIPYTAWCHKYGPIGDTCSGKSNN